MKIYAALIFAIAANASAESHLHNSASMNSLRITPEFINQLAEEARTNHPALRAADSRIAAAKSNVEAVRTWEDPTARFGVTATSPKGFKLSEEGDLTYGLEQKLPLFGKPKAAKEVAKAGVSVEQANADFKFQQVRREIAAAIFKTALADKIVEIGQQDLPWLETMLAATEDRYQSLTAQQIDVLRLQNEKAKRIEQLKTDELVRGHEQVNLNRLLNRDLQTPWPKLELPEIARPVAYSDRLVNLAAKYEPKLKMMRQEIAQAGAVAESTRRQRFPDIGVGVEGRQYSGDGEFREGMFTISLSLPWWNGKKYKADFNRDQFKAKAVAEDFADYELSVRNDVHHLTVKIDAARREALLYRDQILPRSQLALESARAGWESNAGMFRDVLDARRMLLDAQLMSARAVSEQYQLLSELVLCCGLGDLEALQMIGAQLENETPQPKK